MAVTLTNGTRTALSGISGTLASATYGVTAAYNCQTNNPVDVIIEVAVTPGATPAGNKQAIFWIKEAVDGTNFRTGPESGTTATDEPNLGNPALTLPLVSASVLQRGFIVLTAAVGFRPAQFKVVCKNDCGQAFAAVAINTSEQPIP